jgi:hypothetical protein
MSDLAQRIFRPILKTRFKTVGSHATCKPLDFVTVDGHAFRIMSIRRSFNAENNDFNASYECEWLGGS